MPSFSLRNEYSRLMQTTSTDFYLLLLIKVLDDALCIFVLDEVMQQRSMQTSGTYSAETLLQGNPVTFESN